MVHFPGLARTRLWIQRAVSRVYRDGFPHSDIPGSKPACGSPRLIAACHVLLRQLAPRHPPHALSSLTIKLTQHVVYPETLQTERRRVPSKLEIRNAKIEIRRERRASSFAVFFPLLLLEQNLRLSRIPKLRDRDIASLIQLSKNLRSRPAGAFGVRRLDAAFLR